MMDAAKTPAANRFGLVADIGGTNVRFATVDLQAQKPDIDSVRVLSTRGHSDIIAAAKTYLLGTGLDAPPEALVFAVAGPVENNEIHLTNAGWSISTKELQNGLGAPFATLVNDFEAVARLVDRESFLAMAEALTSRGRARTRVRCVVLLPDGSAAATLEARFVAIERR